MLRILLTTFVLLFAYRDVAACSFCNPAVLMDQVVYEGNHFVILLDASPRVYGHLLIVPKEHIVSAHDLSFEAWIELRSLIRHSAAVFAECLHTQAYTILEKNHCPQFQEIPHIHFHLFPVHDESWGEIFNIKPSHLEAEELRQVADLFREYFSSVVYATL